MTEIAYVCMLIYSDHKAWTSLKNMSIALRVCVCMCVYACVYVYLAHTLYKCVYICVSMYA